MTAPDLRALAEAATPGPWRTDAANGMGERVLDDAYRETVCVAAGSMRWWIANAAYIAAASPDVILALLDEIDALRLRDADVILQRNTGSGRVA